MIRSISTAVYKGSTRIIARGLAGYQAPEISGLSADQIRKVAETNDRLRNRHVKIEAAMDAEEKDVARRKRMIYRSKQRGWLEADILMGSWAAKHVPSLTEVELDQYDIILNEETIDIFNFITGKDALPDHLKDLSLMKKLQQYALDSKVFDPEKYRAIKTETNLT